MKETIMKAVLDNLKFVETKAKDYEAIVKGQTPKITLITCSDSRVPPHSICADTVNHVFAIENMGNQLKTAEGTVDYGVHHLHTPVLVVLGHTNCGAVNASLTNYTGESAAIINELATISDGYKNTKARFEEIAKRADMYAEKNVDYQVKLALDKYADLIKAGKLNVIGMMFDFADTYGPKKGHVYVTNVNGETDVSRIKESEIVKGTNAIVKRMTA